MIVFSTVAWIQAFYQRCEMWPLVLKLLKALQVLKARPLDHTMIEVSFFKWVVLKDLNAYIASR